MNPVRVWKNYGVYLGFRSGIFWVRTNKHIYKANAPWHEPLFSERYIDKPKRYLGWRFTKRVDPRYDLNRAPRPAPLETDGEAR